VVAFCPSCGLLTGWSICPNCGYDRFPAVSLLTIESGAEDRVTRAHTNLSSISLQEANNGER
jgi:hypothetical protein